MKEYSHLTEEKREKLCELRLQGMSMTDCAVELGVNKGTVSRELKRNSANIAFGVYLPDRAETLYHGRRMACRPKIKMDDPSFRKKILIEVTKGRSPECIEGRMRQQKETKRISHETLYEWIYKSEIGTRDKLYEYLPRGQKKRRKQKGRGVQKCRLEGRVFIEARSKETNERSEFGHYESDSVLCKYRDAVNTLVERMSRKVFITKLPDKTAAATRTAVVARLRGEPVKSITADNGSENAEHRNIATDLDTAFFFCHPYHSWEKGTNENRNGVIRRYLPRSTDLRTWSQDELDEIADDINNTPMKCLGYQTPNEVYSQLRCTRN
jgi:transposase, IS30 family